MTALDGFSLAGAAAVGHVLDAGPVEEATRPRPAWYSAYLPRVLFADTVSVLGAVALTAKLQRPDMLHLALALGAGIAANVLCGSYSIRSLRSAGAERRAIVQAGGRLAVVGVVLGWLSGVAGLEVVAVVLPLVLAGLMLLGRSVVRHWLGRQYAAGRLRSDVLVCGSSGAVDGFLRAVESDPRSPFQIAGIRLDDAAGVVVDPPKGVRVVASGTAVVLGAVAVGAECIVMVGSPSESPDVLRRVIWSAQDKGVDVLMVPLAGPQADPFVGVIDHVGLLGLTYSSSKGIGGYRLVKDALDRVLAALALLLLAPLLAVVAVAVARSSSGPVLFRQIRVGRHGRNFEMLKFRTMHVDAEERLAEFAHLNEHADMTLFKIKQDPRVTSVGRYLRKLSLDELPQLLNVLRGDMSLVGPRPALPQEIALYSRDRLRRLEVKPGLTGLWQVSGRSDLSAERSEFLDTLYVERQSFALDVAILAKTVLVLVTAEGAY